MKTYRREPTDREIPRSHPWTAAVSNPASRYHDLKLRPDLVRTSLEDFTPWAGYSAVETFYTLLEWINGRDGSLESNDCEFTGPHEHASSRSQKARECSGRLMILYRDLSRNLSLVRVECLEDAVLSRLVQIDPEFTSGAIGTTIMRTRYVGLPVPETEQQGFQLLVSFWAWGDTDTETMGHLDRLFGSLSRVLHEVEAGRTR